MGILHRFRRISLKNGYLMAEERRKEMDIWGNSTAEEPFA
jgi:hypothetical protein